MELEQGGWYGDAAEKLLEASELRRSFLGEAHPEATRAARPSRTRLGCVSGP